MTLISFIFFLYLAVFAGISTAASHTGNETDWLALLAFKSGIKEDPYRILKSWNESQHFCEWHGVTCGRLHQRVTALDLGSSQLTGSISPFIGNLSFLRLLNLENNSFSYAIPPQISNLRRIEHLLLQNNSLVGNIPSNLSACSNLLTFRVKRNKLDGVIPVELGSLSKLTHLKIGYNELTGGIPTSFGNLSSLVTLYLSTNKITGSIPSTLGMLPNLVTFAMADNMLSGTIPSVIFNFSSIAEFDVQINQLQGVLPSYLGNTFTKLNFFGIGHNKFTGSIPLLSNASELIYFGASYNNLTGEIPRFINSAKLFRLFLGGNQLGSGGKFDDLSFFPSLKNCTDIDILDLGDNNLGGIFPKSFLNLSNTLREFFLNDNHISGSIPSGIERFVNLVWLDMSNNRFIGTIPTHIGKLQNLQKLNLRQNKFSGNIPSSLGNLSRLFGVSLADNHLKGSIPSSLGNCHSLNELSLYGNKITGPIPLQIFGISSLTVLNVLDLSENRLTGSLPIEVGKLKNLRALSVTNNLLSGNIPSTLASCLLLEQLYMEGNLFQGKIPSSLSALRGLQYLSLARNNISGPIPDFFGEFELQFLNLSFNAFEGELPNKGIFKNANAVFVNGNERLCGGVPELKLPVCISSGSKKKSRSATYKLIVFTILGVLGLTLILCLLLFCWLKRKRPQQILESSDHVHFRVSYQALRAATDRFSLANMIGSGGFGSVYRGYLDGRLIAVKVLNLEHRAATKSFIAECEALRNIRHRNLVKLLTVCSGIDYQGNDFKAVVYEFMVNGNLDEWLHLVPTKDTDQQRHNMNLLVRLSIAIDVVSALNYLHNDCQPPIVHCDIKPSNVLLDNEMTAHVGDFGLARFIIKRDNNDAIQTSTGGVRGSIGYTPPEYGLGSEMSTTGDVYSFGILLLEMMTGKRPTDDMFYEGHNLHHFAQMSLPDKVTDIVDDVLLQDNEECLISAVKIGVACSLESPKDRMRTSDVLRELNILKALFLKIMHKS